MAKDKRFFKYVGEPVRTRGDYGISLVGGHSTTDAPDYISIFDPDIGVQVWISIDVGLGVGDWVEITQSEWEAL